MRKRRTDWDKITSNIISVLSGVTKLADAPGEFHMYIPICAARNAKFKLVRI